MIYPDGFDDSQWQVISTGYIPDWKVGDEYGLDTVIKKDGLLYYCLTPHTSSDFATEKNNWQALTIGYLPVWEANTPYIIGQTVTRGTSILRSLSTHISAAAFDSVERNEWEVVAGRGAIIPTWQPGTDYGIDEAVIYNDVIYLANAAHTSGATFLSDMQVGIEKWRAVNSGDSLGGILQVTKLGVTAAADTPKIVDIPINYTTTFAVPPAVVLKFTPGTQDVVTTVCAFDNADADDFMAGGKSGEEADCVEFDGQMRPRTAYDVPVGAPTALGSGFISESDEIDFADYKKVEEVM